MGNKEIIIDGVDVSGCPCIQSNNIGDVVCVRLARTSLYCKGQPCYYKALERKEQECERLKHEYWKLEQGNDFLAEKNSKLKGCLNEIKEIAEKLKSFYEELGKCEDLTVVRLKQILQKISECEGNDGN